MSTTKTVPSSVAASRAGRARLGASSASGAAARAGIRPGDIVTAVNGRPVKRVEDLRAAAENAKGTLALLVRRGDASIFVPVEVS